MSQAKPWLTLIDPSTLTEPAALSRNWGGSVTGGTLRANSAVLQYSWIMGIRWVPGIRSNSETGSSPKSHRFVGDIRSNSVGALYPMSRQIVRSEN